MLTCVTGVTGSGKSSLVAEFIDTLRRRPPAAGRADFGPFLGRQGCHPLP